MLPHTTPCSLSRRNAVCPRAGVVTVAAAGVASKLDLLLLIVLECECMELNGAREAEEVDEEEDEVGGRS